MAGGLRGLNTVSTLAGVRVLVTLVDGDTLQGFYIEMRVESVSDVLYEGHAGQAMKVPNYHPLAWY